ncbi:MAG: PssD/Cps14F family polysaccharide biosynthesis glycosyltransferase [Pseudomonadota bacterium]
MLKKPFVLVTDRGGHLHNALKLMEQMADKPSAIVTTRGPDIDSLKKSFSQVFEVPYLFRWFGKKRFFNPLGAVKHVWVSARLVWKLRPGTVISLGASNVVCFCYFARCFGSKVVHVECMNQVTTKSVTGRLLYPICQDLLVQWPELLKVYGPKARYEGWVL